MTGNNNIYQTICKNTNKEYNEKYICCFFSIWNLKCTITYKCGWAVLSHTSVYLPSANPCYYFHILSIYHALYFPTFSLRLYVSCFPFFLIDHHGQQVLLIKQAIFFFWSSKIFFFSFQLFENSHIQNFVLMLINVVKLDTQINNIVLTFTNVVNTIVVNFNVGFTLSDTVTSYCPNKMLRRCWMCAEYWRMLLKDYKWKLEDWEVKTKCSSMLLVNYQ